MGLWVVGGPAGAMLLARGLPNPALLVTNPPTGRDVGEGMADTQSLVGRLASGEVILGDGSYIMTLEKRGYATAGSWTPEAAAEHPEAIEQLGIEFARAGADITQTFTFWAHDDALPKGCKFTCAEINQAACDTAKKVARERGTIMGGGITQTGTFNPGSSVKSKVQTELRKALEVLILNKVSDHLRILPQHLGDGVGHRGGSGVRHSSCSHNVHRARWRRVRSRSRGMRSQDGQGWSAPRRSQLPL